MNYNVPGYSPLDWFVSLGFVPPERWGQWTKIDAALPRVRQNGPVHGEDASSSSQRKTGATAQSRPQSQNNPEL